MTEIRHATTDELLALRDGEGSAWTREHVESCAACAGERYRLDQMRARLRALPAFSPPRDRWPLVAVAARRERRQRWVRSVVGVATAAALAGITFLAVRPGPVASLAAEEARLDRAMARSQAVEAQLRAIAPERRALSGAAAQVAAELEERLGELDARLADPGPWRSEPGRVAELWDQRAGLLSALVDVHVTRVAAAGL
jgi:hypothetical protein